MTDYMWKIICSGNPGKAWIVDMTQKNKLTALIGTSTARKIVTAHNQIVMYLREYKPTTERKE